jgi:hypothetical protein
VEGTKSVQQPERFWPEMIPVLQQAVNEERARFALWRDDARFMAYLLAGLEFARAGDTPKAHAHVEHAFEILPTPTRHPAVLASGLYRAAVFPWHSAFQRHPLAGRALDNIGLCLTDTPAKRDIQGQLNLCRACKRARRGQWVNINEHLTKASPLIGRKSFYNWRTARMILGAMIKP